MASIITLVSCSRTNDVAIESQVSQFPTILSVGKVSSDYADLADAIEYSRTLLNAKQSVKIELAAGTYYLDHPLVLDETFSGTAEQPFVIAAKDNAKVIISGAKAIELNWQPYTEQIFQAKISDLDFTRLYINGALQPMARYPNFSPDVAIFNGYAKDAIAPERIATWANPIGGFVHGLHESRWGDMHYRITGVSKDKSLQLDGGYQNNRRSPMHLTYRFVENIFEELDAPGEWYLDKAASTLYFYPPKGIDIHQAKVEVPQLDNLIELRGTQSKPVKHVQISGIQFSHTQPTFMQTKEPLLRSDWAIYRGGAILLDGTEHIQVKGSSFSQLGGNAIFVSNYNRNTEILNNHIHDIGASAVSFVGNANAVRSPSFEYHEFVPEGDLDFQLGPKTDQYPSHSLVDNNLIHDIGLVEKQVAGVQLSMASDITVSHNSIYRVPRAGINVSEGTWGGHVIEYNDVFDTVLETGDHGAFNSWGRDRFWHPDRAKMDDINLRNPGMYLLDAIKPTILRNNRFQCDHGWDIDLDDGSSNYEIYNNVMLSGGLKLREGFKRIVTNNIILNNSFHPHVWFENSEDIFAHNILLSGHKPILNDHWGQQIDYNLFVNQADLKAAQALGLDTHSMHGEPQFVAPEQGNYQLAEGSLGLELGFKNFPMDQFGVQTEALRVLAETPKFPELFLSAKDNQVGKTHELLGATLKSVETLGEQSALGIADIAGVMILKVAPNSKMAAAGIQVSDVILQVVDTQFGGQDEIKNAADLLAAYQSRKWRGVLEIMISRNQQKQQITINLID
ncbi:PDZ domain-containing protein [Paraglaciecola sp.]|uniref:PDZ domain-containing protein n=1 Tax=Paraglaciecola sp. TaxID=1920173 RepID=UPI00273D6E18|nr:PDZ domain-containing protein [Paraglaciecola sp.]MDP5031711.1 PDZ domain-containing protein [Paraglaciecola sp.]